MIHTCATIYARQSGALGVATVKIIADDNHAALRELQRRNYEYMPPCDNAQIETVIDIRARASCGQ